MTASYPFYLKFNYDMTIMYWIEDTEHHEHGGRSKNTLSWDFNYQFILTNCLCYGNDKNFRDTDVTPQVDQKYDGYEQIDCNFYRFLSSCPYTMKDFGHLISKFSVIGIPLLNIPHRDMQKTKPLHM